MLRAGLESEEKAKIFCERVSMRPEGMCFSQVEKNGETRHRDMPADRLTNGRRR